ncbi:hypothetical protein [Streptomyces sp. NPDC054863]
MEKTRSVKSMVPICAPEDRVDVSRRASPLGDYTNVSNQFLTQELLPLLLSAGPGATVEFKDAPDDYAGPVYATKKDAVQVLHLNGEPVGLEALPAAP